MSGQTGEEMKNENQTGEKEKRGRTIVISGMPGCGSSTTAELLAKKLKMDFFSLGKYTKKQFQDKGETQSAIKQWSTDIGSSKEFHQKSDAMQQSLAKHGNIVIESKLGIHFIGKLADLKVWLEAPIHVRAQRYAKRDNLKYDEALEMLEKKEATILIKKQDHHPDSKEGNSGMICSGIQWIAFYPLTPNKLTLVQQLVTIEENRQDDVVTYIETGILLSKPTSEYELPNPVVNGSSWRFTEQPGLKSRLYIFGAGHVSLTLSKMASDTGFDVVVFDNRKWRGLHV